MANYYQNFGSINEASTSSETRSCKLIFSTGFASPVYTRQKISGKAPTDGGNESIGVFLVDRQTHQPVIKGPIASAKVKIVLLRGDFGGATTGVGGVWTPSEFKKSIITNWKNKKNILLGDLSLVLEHGSGIVGEIWIKHDRNYLSKAKFRLGAMVVDCPYEVQEAISDPFEVKDGRNESISKNGSVSPTDKVWKLKNIRKKGPICKRLECANIVTVKDFLDRHSSDIQALKEIYGSNGKKWEKTVRHAKTCIFDKGCNADGPVGSISQRSNDVSFFDCDGGKEFDNNCYKPLPYENNLFGNTMQMILCRDLSTEDFQECEMFWQPTNHGLEPCHAYQEDGVYGASTTVGYGLGVEVVIEPVNHGLEPFQEDEIYGESTMVGYSGGVEGVVEPENHVVEPCQEDGTYDASTMVGYGGGVKGVVEPENHVVEPCQEDGTYGASTTVDYGGGVDGVMAKKRWMKLRSIWFSMVSFIVDRVWV